MTHPSIAHDFFLPQPTENGVPAVYILRLILHSWSNKDARNILLRLREAASEQTKLIIADHILPLACVDGFAAESDAHVEGAEDMLAAPPLLPNLGKANSNAYWYDLTVRS
jgi:hypothetical protein